MILLKENRARAHFRAETHLDPVIEPMYPGPVSQSVVFVQVLSGLNSVIALAIAAVFAPKSFW